MLRQKLDVGVWRVVPSGISCTHEMGKNRFITNDGINANENHSDVEVWFWPLHFRRKNWLNLSDIKDLLTALAIKRRMLGHAADERKDKNTWEVILKEKDDEDILKTILGEELQVDSE